MLKPDTNILNRAMTKLRVDQNSNLSRELEIYGPPLFGTPILQIIDTVRAVGEAKVSTVDNKGFGEVCSYLRRLGAWYKQTHGTTHHRFRGFAYDASKCILVDSCGDVVVNAVECQWTMPGSYELFFDFIGKRTDQWTDAFTRLCSKFKVKDVHAAMMPIDKIRRVLEGGSCGRGVKSVEGEGSGKRGGCVGGEESARRQWSQSFLGAGRNGRAFAVSSLIKNCTEIGGWSGRGSGIGISVLKVVVTEDRNYVDGKLAFEFDRALEAYNRDPTLVVKVKVADTEKKKVLTGRDEEEIDFYSGYLEQHGLYFGGYLMDELGQPCVDKQGAVLVDPKRILASLSALHCAKIFHGDARLPNLVVVGENLKWIDFNYKVIPNDSLAAGFDVQTLFKSLLYQSASDLEWSDEPLAGRLQKYCNAGYNDVALVEIYDYIMTTLGK